MRKAGKTISDRVIICRIERCLGCKSCEIACAVAHSHSDELHDAIRERPIPQRRLRVEATGEGGLPLQCRHCEDAPCVIVCPTKAARRLGEHAPVLIDEQRCIGCKLCLIACPFGVIEVSRHGKAVVKCDLCIKRLELGEEPACVVACPTKALKFEEIDEHTRRKRKAAVEHLKSEAKDTVRKQSLP